MPGDRPELLAKSADRGADALILDLEDAVPVSAKDAAREHVAAHLRAVDGGPQRWVRINATSIDEDVAATRSSSLAGIVLAKADPGSLERLDHALTVAESAAGTDSSITPVIALVETAVAIEELRAVARAARVQQLAIGEVDLTAELGVRPGPEDIELDPVRMRLVVASAAVGILPPIGPVSTDFRDLDELRASTERLSRRGFGARQVIHPAQVGVVNEVLSPSENEVARARAVVEAFERAEAEGGGVVLDGGGRMVDRAVVRSARRVLARADPN